MHVNMFATTTCGPQRQSTPSAEESVHTTEPHHHPLGLGGGCFRGRSIAVVLQCRLDVPVHSVEMRSPGPPLAILSRLSRLQ
jgi:hypothetical protein